MRCAIQTGVLSLAALSISAPLFAQNDLDQRINREADSLLATYKPPAKPGLPSTKATATISPSSAIKTI